jgi:predicted nucleic acid-binding protein
MPLILDASVTLASVLVDEQSAITDTVFRRAEDEGAAAPAIWWYEWRNALLLCERRGRLSSAQSAQITLRLRALAVELIEPSLTDAELPLARDHRLTVYDAAYIDAAIRTGRPLATLDRKLARVANHFGLLAIECALIIENTPTGSEET